jgi:hypothetical protein
MTNAPKGPPLFTWENPGAMYGAMGAVGGMLGGLNGAGGGSALTNFAISTISALAGNGLGAVMGQQKFLSKETLYSTLALDGASVAMHFLAKSASDRRLEPRISFAPDCQCKNKSWAEKVSEPQAQASMER